MVSARAIFVEVSGSDEASRLSSQSRPAGKAPLGLLPGGTAAAAFLTGRTLFATMTSERVKTHIHRLYAKLARAAAARPSQHHTGLRPRRALAQAHTHRVMTAHPVEVETRSEGPTQ
jgi:hypothetical protein